MHGTVNLIKCPWLVVHRPQGNLQLLFWWIHMESNCPLNPYLYIHGWIQPSDLTREVSLCSRWLFMQNLTTGQSTENKCLWSAQPQIGRLCHTPFSQGSMTIVEEGAEKLSKPDIRLIDVTRVWHSQTHSSCYYKPINILAWSGKGLMSPPTLVEKLLTINGF